MFPNVKYNEGAGYNVSTGKFSAPVSGLYAFVKQICTQSGQFAFTQFVHNGQAVLGSEIAAHTFDSCASAQVFLYLSKGDQVWVKTGSYSNNYFRHDEADRTLSFAGVFIRM